MDDSRSNVRLNGCPRLRRSRHYVAVAGTALLLSGCGATRVPPPGGADSGARGGVTPVIDTGSSSSTPDEDANRDQRLSDWRNPAEGAAAADRSVILDVASGSEEGGIRGLVDAAAVDVRPSGGVLVYSRTTAVRHLSIPRAVMTLQRALRDRGFVVEASEDPEWFMPGRLQQLAAVILVSTTGHPLGEPGTAALAALDEFVRTGGVLVGFHAASSTQYAPTLPYTNLIGGKFLDHPGGVRTGRCHAEGVHPAVALLPEPFITEDEIYRMTNLRPDNRVILTCEAFGENRRLPIAWHREEGAGRVFYSALGHGENDWLPDSRYFKDHALPGILWALGR
jgi:type 1 glutamine amidotransferase